jgi:hypothetical protein
MSVEKLRAILVGWKCEYVYSAVNMFIISSGVPRIFSGGVGGVRQEFFRGVTPGFFFGGVTPRIFSGGRGSTNSVEDRGQRERGAGGGSPLIRGSTQFANEQNPYSD